MTRLTTPQLQEIIAKAGLVTMTEAQLQALVDQVFAFAEKAEAGRPGLVVSTELLNKLLDAAALPQLYAYLVAQGILSPT